MLGDVVATSAECDNGQAQVNQMDSVFQSLPGNLSSQFQSAHDSIMSAFQGTWFTGIDWIPFYQGCGTIAQIGQQAVALTIQMQNALGQTPIGAPSQPMDLSTILILIGLGYVGLVYFAGHVGR